MHLDGAPQARTIVVRQLGAGQTLRLRPAAAERFEDRGRLPSDLDTAQRQAVLRIQAHALGVEHSQEIVSAELESLSSELGSRARGPRSQFQMAEALPFTHIACDRALSLLERKECRSLIGRERDLGRGIGGQDALTDAVPLEKRQRDTEAKTKTQTLILDVAQVIGLQPDSPREHQAGEQICRRHACPRRGSEARPIRPLPRRAAGAAT